MRTYLVTGGAGFIGSNYIHYMFRKYDNEIRIINVDCLTYAGNLENLKDVEDRDNYTFVKANICDKEAIEKIFAEKLLNVKAIKLQPEQPFTWASGWKSPFYCDNRKTLSFPALRNFVKIELARIIAEEFPEADAVAGVATGAIAQGALVAEELALPFCYVRAKAKDHGMGNLIEGELPEGSKVIVIEDLISTGGSSLKAVEALRAAGYNVIGMVASYTYGFPVAEKAFADANVRLVTLTNYEAVVEVAKETGYIKAEHVPMLAEWRANPSEWMK